MTERLIGPIESAAELRDLGVVVDFGVGNSGHCQLLEGGVVRKTYTHGKVDNRMAREVRALTRLAPYNHFPKLVHADPASHTLYMTYVGENVINLDPAQVPSDYHAQLDEIIYALKTADVFHTDLHLYHVTLLESRLYLIDFEKSMTTEEASRLGYRGVEKLRGIVAAHFEEVLRTVE